MDGLSVLAWAWLGLRLAPCFRPPWQVQSVKEFWGSAWNLAASDAVRCSVYEPALEGAWVRSPGGASRGEAGAAPGRWPPRREAATLCTACLSSGVVHELIVWFIAGQTTPRGSWLLFFALQASRQHVLPCLALPCRCACVGVFLNSPTSSTCMASYTVTPAPYSGPCPAGTYHPCGALAAQPPGGGWPQASSAAAHGRQPGRPPVDGPPPVLPASRAHPHPARLHGRHAAQIRCAVGRPGHALRPHSPPVQKVDAASPSVALWISQ